MRIGILRSGRLSIAILGAMIRAIFRGASLFLELIGKKALQFPAYALLMLTR